MRCKACDAMISHPVWNSKLNDWELCPTCLTIVNETFEDPIVEDPYEEIDEEEEDFDFETFSLTS